MVTPRALKDSMSSALACRVDGREKMEVGWPSMTLAWAMCLPMYPVPPKISTLLLAPMATIHTELLLSSSQNPSERHTDMERKRESICTHASACVCVCVNVGILFQLSPQMILYGQIVLVSEARVYVRVSVCVCE
eukprot:c44072_g1_i1 orf=28-432(+)